MLDSHIYHFLTVTTSTVLTNLKLCLNLLYFILAIATLKGQSHEKVCEIMT
jgi:hypothetical protein